MNYRNFIGCVLISLLVAISPNLFAGIDPPAVQTLFGKNGQILQGAVLQVEDPVFADQGTRSTILHTNKITNIISLKIDENSSSVIQSDFDVTVNLNIEKTDEQMQVSQFSKSLTLKYSKANGAITGSESYIVTEGAYRLSVTIADVITNNANWDVLQVLMLQASVQANRQYAFDCMLPLSVTGQFVEATDGIDELKLGWPLLINGYTDFDLEWAWIEEGVMSRYQDPQTQQWLVNKIFYNNSTRVTVPATSNSYNVPLYYDGTGYLFYRVRMVQRIDGGARFEGAWSDPQTYEKGYNYYAGHENNLNWQASTVYAEEGKRKSVLQYYDGTLRSRQTVTKDNSIINEAGTNEPTTIVAETYYDYQGRPAVQVLPAPTLSTVIHYAHNFNKVDYNPSLGYPKSAYDEWTAGNTTCDQGAMAMSQDELGGENSGAAFYYGPKNHIPGEVQSKFNNYIPDSHGFPFTETRYTADATGRVEAQSGVGPDHKIGSGHETKYYYTSPAQEELDALFATDAGEASHYSKNVVSDANGQFSVSYVDMFGRTVATALAGYRPYSDAKVNTLPLTTMPDINSLPARTHTLLDASNNVVRGNTIEMVRDLVVTNPGEYVFNYSFDPSNLTIDNCASPPAQICYDCLYDLEITITGDCNNAGLPCNQPVVITKKNFTLPQPGTVYQSQCSTDDLTWDAATSQGNCNYTNNIYISQAGKYTITKKLTVNSQMQQHLRDNVFLPNNSCKSLAEYIDEYRQLMVQNAECQPSCASCSTIVSQGKEAYITAFQNKMGLTATELEQFRNELSRTFDELVKNCNQICTSEGDESDRVISYREMMLEDMSPDGGQYARLFLIDPQTGDNVNPPVSSTNKPYNIFNSQSQGGARYRLPVDESGIADVYRDETGAPDVTAGGLSQWLPDNFSSNFKESWAGQLIFYHPEFKKLKIIESQPVKNCVKWGERLQEYETWAAAQAAGFTGLPQSDPLYQQLSSSGLQIPFKNKVEDVFTRITVTPQTCTYLGPIRICNPTDEQASIPVNMWKFAVLAIRCSAFQAGGSDQLACIQQMGISNTIGQFPAGTCDEDKSRIWQIFRNIYLAERENKILEHLNVLAPVNNQDLINNGYMPRFFLPQTNVSTMLPSSMQQYYSSVSMTPPGPNTSTDVAGALKAEYRKNCEDYVQRWLNITHVYDQCAGQPIAKEKYDALMAKLVDICVRGSDDDHPFGSSTVAPSDNQPDKSFVDVLNRFMNENGINNNTPECNPYVINWPPPYDKQAPAGEEEIDDIRPDDCICDRIKTLNQEYQLYKTNNPGYTASFRSYLVWRHGADISEADLNTLVAGCNTTVTQDCHFLAAPIKIPAVLQCGASNSACISCEEYRTYRDEFFGKFAVPAGVNVPVISPANDLEAQWNNAFQQFMNNRTGFSKQWFQYAEFAAQCAPYVSNSISCGLMQEYYAEFKSRPTPQGEERCVAFVSEFNQRFGTDFSLDQIKLAYSTCGICNFDGICEAARITRVQFEQSLADFYAYAGNNAFENQATGHDLFTDYFNSHFQVNYSYDEIMKTYEYLSDGDVIDVADKLNTFRLRFALQQFRDIYPNAWQTAGCGEQYLTFFNNYFGVNYDNSQLEGLYADKKITLDPCKSAFSCDLLKETLDLFYNKFGGSVTEESGCEDKFRVFFNEKHGTDYTVSQLLQLYSAVCGGINICKRSISCDKLLEAYKDFEAANPGAVSGGNCSALFTQFMNNRFAAAYDYVYWQQIFTQSCINPPAFCKQGELIANRSRLDGILYTFRLLHPNPRAEFGTDCLAAYTKYLNQLAGTNYTAQEVLELHLNLCGTALDICEVSQCTSLQSLLAAFNQKYGGLKLTEAATIKLFTVVFNSWYNSKEKLDYKQIVELYGKCDIVFALPQQYTADINDAAMLQSLLTAFNTVKTAENRENCANDFTAFFNVTMDAKETFEEIQKLYTTVCGSDLNVCNYTEVKSVALRSSRSDCGIAQPRLCGLNEPITPVVDTEADDPCKDFESLALIAATEKWNLEMATLKGDFDKQYQQKCLNVQGLETFTVSFVPAEYHYTLYYYDQAGNLVKTVPPAGVDEHHDQAYLNAVADARAHDAVFPYTYNGVSYNLPDHQLVTEYRYNTLNQVVQQKSPDGGTSSFWYDNLGRLTLSQNEKQLASNQYSYTLYDPIGRITEVGLKPKKSFYSTNDELKLLCRDQDAYKNWIINEGPGREQVTRTVYDFCYDCTGNINVLAPYFVQDNLRNRVSYVQVFDVYPKSVGGAPPVLAENHNTATYYTYDISGNVKELLQDYNDPQSHMKLTGNRFKKMQYEYDLVSGKVNSVAYQAGQLDQFYHRYSYDAENRITEAYTSHDGVLWERDARYEYYKHGPLARTVLGQQQVQGIDYAYTLQGWLKGVNSSSVVDQNHQSLFGGLFDMSLDGVAGKGNDNIARDAYSYMLNYYPGDYTPIHELHKTFMASGMYSLNTLSTGAADPSVVTAKPLYNGNIASMMVNLPSLGDWGSSDAMLYGYQYDQLNRLIRMDAFTGFVSKENRWANDVSAVQNDTRYREKISYDANGNILSYQRNGDLARLQMDNLTYTYIPGTNKLSRVLDNAPDPGNPNDYSKYNDIKYHSQQADNYKYDLIGNLVNDYAEGLGNNSNPAEQNIDWNVYGKISHILKYDQNGAPVHIYYTYDASGNRISKRVLGQGGELDADVTTYYVRDASGNVMAVYEKGGAYNHLTQTEVHLYGSSRLGMYKPNRDMEAAPSAEPYPVTVFERGRKFFELSNHLGNVLVTISDKKTGIDNTNDHVIDYYLADVVTANDYYSFGMQMPDRKFNASNSDYRYGFNGQEKSDDVTVGNYTAMYWEYDSRIGRRWNLDPVPKVGESDYSCFGNNPIFLSDPNGNDPDPPGKKSKGYDWVGALHYLAIHYNGARVAYNIYRARQTFGHYGEKYNDPYKKQISSRAAASYQSENMAVTGISEAAYAKVIEGYYESFEKGFNWAGDRTMRELKFIFDNKYEAAKDVFKPNLTQNQAYDAIYQCDKLLDDLTGTAYTIGQWGEEVFMKCVMFAGLFANRAGNYFPNNNLSNIRGSYKGSILQQKIVDAGVINLKYASPQPNGISYSFEISGGMLNISGRAKTNGKFDFVITNSGELKIGSGHYYLSGGASSVKAAGRLKIWNGKVTYLNANSGHYRPNAAQAQQGQNLLNQIVNGRR